MNISANSQSTGTARKMGRWRSKHSIPLIYPATKGIPYKGIWHTVVKKTHPVMSYQQTASTNSYLLSAIHTQCCIYLYYKHPCKRMLAQASIITFMADNFNGYREWEDLHIGEGSTTGFRQRASIGRGNTRSRIPTWSQQDPNPLQSTFQCPGTDTK